MLISNTETSRFENLEITGDIFIQPVPANEQVPQWKSWRYLIMGPTGAGKSTLIEVLSGANQNLRISKDQLAGYTQRVTAYQLMNVNNGHYPIYLVDTPGFSDIKISETEIMSMVRKWMAKNGISYFHKILFLTPITEPRLGGSRRRTIEMLKEFVQPSAKLQSISFITTMWDLLYSERAHQRAESNFAQLRDQILKDFIDEGAKVEKFRNTKASALHMLDTTYVYGFVFSEDVVSDKFAHLYQDLHRRIECALQQKKTLESDLASAEAQKSVALKSILQDNHRENEETLAKFIGQFARFRNVPTGFADAAEGLRMTIVAEATPINSRYKEIFDFWAKGVDPDELPEDLYPDNPSHTLALKGIIRRLLKTSKQRGSKWFQHSA